MKANQTFEELKQQLKDKVASTKVWSESDKQELNCITRKMRSALKREQLERFNKIIKQTLYN